MTTITEKQKCIAEQAIYGDLYFNECSFPIRSISSIDVYLPMDMVMDIDMVKLTLRPLTDLTKEITHKGYNDDKPFIPLVELAKISMQDGLLRKYYKPSQFTLQGSEVGLLNYAFYYEKRECFSWRHRYISSERGSALYQQQLFDLLHLLHFDTRGLIEQGEAIDVNSLPKNPYEV